jgi:hypothetical protein
MERSMPQPDDPHPIATYAHRAKPYAGEAKFRLYPTHVAIEQGRRSGDFPLADVAMIRLLYKPRNTTNEGYQAKLYRRDRRTAALTNLSWKSLVDMERQDADYRRFVEALIGAAAAANPGIALRAGMPAWLHRLTAAAGAAALLALVLVTARAASEGSLPLALVAGLLGLYCGWWSWRYLARNRPRAFTPGAIPEDVLPR